MPETKNNTEKGGGNALLIVVAWAIVGIPALWGVAQTLRTSLNLFEKPTANSSVVYK